MPGPISETKERGFWVRLRNTNVRPSFLLYFIKMYTGDRVKGQKSFGNPIDSSVKDSGEPPPWRKP